ncbi:MAG: hypothetical protein HC820_01425 [Hydrococcus sp. RM1_1_31]|nr:hypothetical protein [Hydrococcus sp. RM1_1_31]
MSETFPNQDRQLDLKVTERLVLSNRERDLFLSAMENPPTLNDSLKSAIQKYREEYDR